MLANLHTHTTRCNHAAGTEREYVENALSMGMEIFGFSDHTPYVFPGDYYSNFRMKLHELGDYSETVCALRREFAGQIEIPLGLELEFYPKYLPDLLPILRDYPIDYLLLGQHFIGNEINEHYSGLATGDSSILQRYVNQTIDAMQSGLFTYFAHPDLINFKGDEKLYRDQMRRLCREAKSCGMVLELNLLGMREGRNYPDIRFWEEAAGEGCNVVLGQDAHAPKHVLDLDTEHRALVMIDRLQLNLLETVPLRSIR